MITSTRLAPQLFIHDADVLESSIPSVTNNPSSLGKPRGGLWTSTYVPEYGSGWVRWCVAYRYNEPLDLHWTVLIVPPSARIATIDSPEDLAALIERYPQVLRRRRGLDFERLARDYEGLHLTEKGYLQTPSTRSRVSLIGWDCESTLWFRWIFSERHEVTPSFSDIDVYDDLWLQLSGWSADDHACHRMPAEKASRKVYERMLREIWRLQSAASHRGNSAHERVDRAEE